MVPSLLLLVPDLFFQARLETAAKRLNLRVLKASTWKEALEQARKSPPAGAVVDLSGKGAASGLRFLEKARAAKGLAGMKTLGFLEHGSAEVAGKARKAGCGTVVTRNALSQDTPGYLRRLVGFARPEPAPAPAKPEKPARLRADEEE
jgi:ActR/RegA family two-component response regulator